MFYFSILYYLIFTSFLFLHDFLLLLAWVFMYFFNYSFGQKVLCNGLLWGHTWPLFTDKGQQSGEVLQALIDLCDMCILRFSLRFAFYHCLARIKGGVWPRMCSGAKTSRSRKAKTFSTFITTWHSCETQAKATLRFCHCQCHFFSHRKLHRN